MIWLTLAFPPTPLTLTDADCPPVPPDGAGGGGGVVEVAVVEPAGGDDEPPGPSVHEAVTRGGAADATALA